MLLIPKIVLLKYSGARLYKVRQKATMATAPASCCGCELLNQYSSSTVEHNVSTVLIVDDSLFVRLVFLSVFHFALTANSDSDVFASGTKSITIGTFETSLSYLSADIAFVFGSKPT